MSVVAEEDEEAEAAMVRRVGVGVGVAARPVRRSGDERVAVCVCVCGSCGLGSIDDGAVSKRRARLGEEEEERARLVCGRDSLIAIDSPPLAAAAEARAAAARITAARITIGAGDVEATAGFVEEELGRRAREGSPIGAPLFFERARVKERA